MSGADAYLKSSKMARRVEAWTTRMEPLLAAEEVREERAAKPSVVEASILRSCAAELGMPPHTAAAAAAAAGAAAAASSAGAILPPPPIPTHAPMDWRTVLTRTSASSKDVARIFLSTLQLANNGNLDIVPFSATEEGEQQEEEQEGEEGGWLASQDVPYASQSTPSAAQRAVGAANRRVQQARAARLAGAVPLNGVLEVPPSFGIVLLRTALRSTEISAGGEGEGVEVEELVGVGAAAAVAAAAAAAAVEGGAGKGGRGGGAKGAAVAAKGAQKKVVEEEEEVEVADTLLASPIPKKSRSVLARNVGNIAAPAPAPLVGGGATSSRPGAKVSKPPPPSTRSASPF